jgi:hypothetical protein
MDLGPISQIWEDRRWQWLDIASPVCPDPGCDADREPMTSGQSEVFKRLGAQRNVEPRKGLDSTRGFRVWVRRKSKSRATQSGVTGLVTPPLPRLFG